MSHELTSVPPLVQVAVSAFSPSFTQRLASVTHTLRETLNAERGGVLQESDEWLSLEGFSEAVWEVLSSSHGLFLCAFHAC